MQCISSETASKPNRAKRIAGKSDFFMLFWAEHKSGCNIWLLEMWAHNFLCLKKKEKENECAFGMSSCYTYIKLERSRHSIYSLLCLLYVQTTDTVPPPWHAHTVTRRTLPKLLDAFYQIIGDMRGEGSLIFSALAQRYCKNKICASPCGTQIKNFVFIRVAAPVQIKHKTFYAAPGP